MIVLRQEKHKRNTFSWVMKNIRILEVDKVVNCKEDGQRLCPDQPHSDDYYASSKIKEDSECGLE